MDSRLRGNDAGMLFIAIAMRDMSSEGDFFKKGQRLDRYESGQQLQPSVRVG